jgi:NADPH-dependent 2,4-dienoyl-CoA reductase/sulfur reductase-like enzyme
MNAELVRYLSTEISRLDVDIRTSTPVTASLLRELNADVVVVATGARRERPDVPGAQLPHVFSGDDLRALLTGDDPSAAARLPIHRRLMVSIGRSMGFMSSMDRVRSMSKRWMPIGKHVVVVGGGLVGVELAEYLAERGRAVTVLEAGDKLGLEMAHPRRARALFEARSRSVEFVTNAELLGITESGVSYRIGDESRTVRADAVVIASGVHADTAVAQQLIDDGFEVHVVGDAGSVGYIEGAIRTGYVTARSL